MYSIVLFISASGGPASRMLSISPSKVREIDDPVTKTLMQLHKIIYIDQVSYTTTKFVFMSSTLYNVLFSKSILADM